MIDLRLTAAAVLICSNLGAQVLPDSTVSIVAYWTPGEKYSFECKTDQYRVNEKGDTTWTSRESEIRTIEVISQTKDSYELAITYSDYWNSDPTAAEMVNMVERKFGGMKVMLKTDEMGSPVEITNLPELVKYTERSLKPMVSSMMKNPGMDGIPEKKLLRFLRDKYCTYDAICNSIYDDLGKLFYFYGMNYKLDEEYEFEDRLASLIPGMDSLDCTSSVWIDTDLTDDYSVVIREYSEVPSEQLKDLAVHGGLNIAKLLAKNDVTDDMIASVADSVSSSLKSIIMVMEDYVSEEVHLDTGWPLRYYYDRDLTLTVPGENGSEDKVTKRCKSQSVEIILEDEQEESEQE